MTIGPFEIRRGEPGFRRNQLVVPRPGVVRADVEDDFHHFWVEILHDGERVLDLSTQAVRWPWTTCPSAGAFLAEQLRGQRLDSLAEVDSALLHCTHQHDLALLAAAHAQDMHPTLYSSFAGDRRSPALSAELYRNGSLLLSWEIAESQIVSPGPGQGESLRQLRTWAAGLSPDLHEAALMLRRTVFIAGGREFNFGQTLTADKVTQSAGACFTFQPGRSAQSRLNVQLRDFSHGEVPLQARIEEINAADQVRMT